MSRPKLQRCINGCCCFVDGKLVSKTEYEAALQQHNLSETISVCFQVKPRCQDAPAIQAHLSSSHKREHI
jgi:hypothetical protein